MAVLDCSLTRSSQNRLKSANRSFHFHSHKIKNSCLIEKKKQTVDIMTTKNSNKKSVSSKKDGSTTSHKKKKKTSSPPPKQDPPGFDDVSLMNSGSTDEDIEVGLDSIVLDAREDPFAPRDGKTLLWRNINMTLVSFLEWQCEQDQIVD